VLLELGPKLDLGLHVLNLLIYCIGCHCAFIIDERLLFWLLSDKNWYDLSLNPVDLNQQIVQIDDIVEL
jgi:hypothetical protein